MAEKKELSPVRKQELRDMALSLVGHAVSLDLGQVGRITNSTFIQFEDSQIKGLVAHIKGVDVKNGDYTHAVQDLHRAIKDSRILVREAIDTVKADEMNARKEHSGEPSVSRSGKLTHDLEVEHLSEHILESLRLTQNRIEPGPGLGDQ